MHTLIAPFFTGTPLNILPVAPLYALVSVLALATKVSNIAASLRTQEQLSEERITKLRMPKDGRTAHRLIHYICKWVCVRLCGRTLVRPHGRTMRHAPSHT